MIRAGAEREAARAAVALTLIHARQEAEAAGMDEHATVEHMAEAVLALTERGIRRAVMEATHG